MTDNNNNNIETAEDKNRTWMEKNAATIYGIAVFTALAAIGIIHNLTAG